MASIQKRGSRYRVQVMVDGVRKSASFTTKKAAEDWRKRMEGDRSAFDAMPDGEARRRSLKDAFDGWVADYDGRDTAIQSRAGWWTEEHGTVKLSRVTRAWVRERRRELETTPAVRYMGKNRDAKDLGRPRSPATVNRYMAALSQALTWAVNEGWIADNPARTAGRKTEPRGRIRFLSDEERGRLLTACDASPWAGLGLLVRLALSTGARRGELLGLTWRDINLKAGTATLHDTKNGEARTLTLVPAVVERFKVWSKVRRLDSELVFPARGKAGVTKAFAIERPWKEALAEAGVNDFRFHDLRHSAASYLAMNGATLLEIADVLGHRTLQMVQRYSHLSNAHKAALVNRVMTGLV